MNHCVGPAPLEMVPPLPWKYDRRIPREAAASTIAFSARYSDHWAERMPQSLLESE